jgi:hypothetical protein
MRETTVKKQVMNMCSVRTKRRATVNNSKAKTRRYPSAAKAKYRNQQQVQQQQDKQCMKRLSE